VGSSRDSTLLRKLSVYFLLRGAKFGEVTCEKHSSDVVRGGPGRWPERPLCCQCLALIGMSTGRRAPDAGCFLFMRPVWLDLIKGCLTESTGRSECVRWYASGVRASCNPLCARVR